MHDQRYCNRDHIFFKKASTMPAATPVAASYYWWRWLFVIFHSTTAYYWGSLLSPLSVTLRYFLLFAATQTHFQDPASYTSMWRICGLRKSNQNHILFFEKYKNSLKCQRQCQWHRLITGAAYVADWLFVTSYWGAGWVRAKNIHAMLMWHFAMLEIPHFVIEFVSNLCCFNSVLLSDNLSVKPCGWISDSSFLGLYSADEVWVSSEFYFSLQKSSAVPNASEV